MEYTSATRREWFKDYNETGSVSATCRRFGISRVTFYKWLKRYDSSKPSKPLLSRSRRRRRKPHTMWNADDLNILAELDNQTGARLGAGRLALKLQGGDMLSRQISRATVGRMLAKIRRRCPMCGTVDGHSQPLHALKQDLLTHAMNWEERRARQDFAVSGIGRSPN